MNTETTALKKFTAANDKVKNLLAQDTITLKDIEHLDTLERQHLAQLATDKLKLLKGVERDNYLTKIEQVMHAGTKSNLWEYNHSAISTAISNYMGQYGVMPTQNTLVEQTGLSRQTISKHLKDYKSTPEFMEHIEKFKFMAPKILSSVFRNAAHGDMRAARLYFEMVGSMGKQQTNTVINEQNNYIQVNNTILSQETLKQLTAEQLNQIENIVTNKELKSLVRRV